MNSSSFLGLQTKRRRIKQLTDKKTENLKKNGEENKH